MASRPTRKAYPPALVIRCETFKVGYATYEAAWDGAERAMEQGLVSPGCHLTPYECTRCGEWHIRNRQIVFGVPSENVSVGPRGARARG